MPTTYPFIKRAAVRGIAYEMVRQGAIQFPSKLAMDEAADALADVAHEMPDTTDDMGHHPQDVAEIAAHLREIADQLMAEAGGIEGAPEELAAAGAAPFNPEVGKMAEELSKTAAGADYEAVAEAEALACMDKAAEEYKRASAPAGQPGAETNTLSSAAKDEPVAAMENARRPAGYADIPQGAGALAPAPASAEVGTEGDAKSAAWNNALKLAARSLVGLDAKDNTLADAAKDSDTAKMEKEQRPADEGKQTQGAGLKDPAPASAEVGDEKKAADAAFLVLFNKTAAEIGKDLPKSLTDDQKVAAIRMMMGLDDAGKQMYLTEIQKKAAETEQSNAAEKLKEIANSATK